MAKKKQRWSWLDGLIGKPLTTEEGEEHKIGVLAGVPFLGLDALASAAYGPEAALTILIPLGLLGVQYGFPIFIAILAILGILFLSYWQTIGAYPNGGGSYTVASENLGRTVGLYAGAALILDYMLDVAVGISAGVGALVSAAPSLHRHILALTLIILVIVTIVNLRGVRSSGLNFALPTYLFVASLTATLAVGLWRATMTGGHPVPIEPLPVQPPGHVPGTPLLMVWLLLRAFASGCTAMTGVEAISNGVPVFTAPAQKRAKQTLGVIVGVLALFLLGIMLLCKFYHAGATDPDSPNYQSIISQLTAAIWGRNWMYYITIGSTLAVLALSANTGFADFPRLCRLLSLDEFMPRSFSNRGRRLVFSTGIVVLAVMTAVILVIFGGITDRLIPLFAVGAFLAFTLSQFGMVAHWTKHPSPHSGFSKAVNLLGGISTSIALAIIVVAKFAEGAWISILFIPGMVFMFTRIKRYYIRVSKAIATDTPLNLAEIAPPVVVVPMREWTTITAAGLRYAMRISDDVYCAHVMADEEISLKLETRWPHLVEDPCKEEGRKAPKLMILSSPFRSLQMPLFRFIDDLRGQYPNRPISVIVPELQEAKWYQYLLHNQRATALKAGLLFYGHSQVNVINVPWYLDK
jgi:amino acid transporter